MQKRLFILERIFYDGKNDIEQIKRHANKRILLQEMFIQRRGEGIMSTRTYTNVGNKNGYEQEEIDKAIERVKWEPFRRDNLPFCQGEAIKAVVSQCNVPLSKILRMDLHGYIKDSHGFYALDVKYKNGQAQIYIADNGCQTCVVASDFAPVESEVRV